MADRRWLWATALTIVLAGCDNPPQDAVPQAAAIIPCAVNGASEYTEVCIAKLLVTDGNREIMVHHPDGGFRAFTVLNNGRGLAMADGSDQAVITADSTGIAVSVSGDRYRFPATIFANDLQ